MNVTTHTPAIATAPDETGAGKDDARTDAKHLPQTEFVFRSLLDAAAGLPRTDFVFRSLLDPAAGRPSNGRSEPSGRRASRKAAGHGDASGARTDRGAPDRPGPPDGPGTRDPIACTGKAGSTVSTLDDGDDDTASACRPAPDEGAPDASLPPSAPDLSLLASKAESSGGGTPPEQAPRPHAAPAPPQPGPRAASAQAPARERRPPSSVQEDRRVPERDPALKPPGERRSTSTTRDPISSHAECQPTGSSSNVVPATGASALAAPCADVSGKILTTANAPALDPGPAAPPPRSEAQTHAESVLNQAVMVHAAHGELDHPELGPIQVTARLRDGEVDVRVTAHRLETVAILVPRIDAMAAAANVPAARIEVGTRGEPAFAHADAPANGGGTSDGRSPGEPDRDDPDGSSMPAGPRRVRIVL